MLTLYIGCWRLVWSHFQIPLVRFEFRAGHLFLKCIYFMKDILVKWFTCFNDLLVLVIWKSEKMIFGGGCASRLFFFYVHCIVKSMVDHHEVVYIINLFITKLLEFSIQWCRRHYHEHIEVLECSSCAVDVQTEIDKDWKVIQHINILW